MNLVDPLNICPVCERELEKPFDKHHLVPKSKGGKETVYLHKICHRKIHSVFTEVDLKKNFNTIEKLKEHPEIIKFINWIRNKPSGFYKRTKNIKN